MIFDLPYEKTFDNLLRSITLGEYRIGQSRAIYLDIKYLKSQGIYDEVWTHEMTHLQLTTSTTIGHALMFLANSGLISNPYFRDIFDFLMKLSWEAQEGAATLTAWHVAQTKNPETRERQFLDNHSKQYRDAFNIFNEVSQILLPPESYWMKPIVANAMGQFFLNTDILLKLASAFRGHEKGNLQGYFNSTENHPQRRRLLLQSELGGPNSSKSEDRRNHMLRELENTRKRLEKMFPSFISGRQLSFSKANKSQRMKVSDELNQTFLKFFCKVTSLPLAASHSYEVGEQYDDLVKAAEEQAGKSLNHLHRFDMSRNLNLRAQFRPFIIDYVSGKIVESLV
jgi:hypothetical protein